MYACYLMCILTDIIVYNSSNEDVVFLKRKLTSCFFLRVLSYFLFCTFTIALCHYTQKSSTLVLAPTVTMCLYSVGNMQVTTGRWSVLEIIWMFLRGFRGQ